MITLDQNSEDFANRFRDLLNANYLLIAAGVDPEDPVIDMTVLAFFDQYAVAVPETDEEAPEELPEAPQHPPVTDDVIQNPDNRMMGYVIRHVDTKVTARRFENNLYQSVSAAKGTLDTVGTKEAQSAYDIVPVYS